MSNDAFAPPESDLEIASQGPEVVDKFYVVSMPKFITLYVVTLGLYSVFWFYMNWRNYRQATGWHMWPIARAIFSIFFAHSLFSEISEELRLKKIEYKWMAMLWATVYVLFTIVSNIFDRFVDQEAELAAIDFVAFVFWPVIMLSLARAQVAINISQDDPKGARNSQFTVYNFLWIALGAFVLLALAVGFADVFGLLDSL
jgi:hypothetical protein